MPEKSVIKRVDEPLVVRNAEIAYRNFSGKQSQYNAEGKKNFCIFFDPDTGTALENDGWLIRWKDAREEGDLPQPYLQVSVAYEHKPPKVMFITSRGSSFLDAKSIEILDYADIKKVDLIIQPFNWVVGVKGGVKAYLKEMYVTADESELAAEYSAIPQVPLVVSSDDTPPWDAD